MSLRRLVTVPGLPALVTAAVAVAVLVDGAAPAREIAAYAGYVGLGVALPGVFGWRLLLARMHVDVPRQRTWLEDLSLGTIFGFGIQLPCFLVGVAVGVPRLVLVLPAAVLVASATQAGRRAWTLPTERLHPGAAWGLAGVALYGLAWLWHHAAAGQPVRQSNQVGVDVTFHQALVADIAERFPPQLPFLLDTRLDYHWFVHAQIATARTVTGIDSALQLRLLLPVLAMLLIVTGLGAVALRLSERSVAAVVAPALLVVGVFHLLGLDYPEGEFTEPFLTWRYVTSPSQTYGVMMSIPVLGLIVEALRPGLRPTRGTWAALAIALLALSGSKATFLPIFVCGALGAWTVALLAHRRVDRAATYVVVLAGGATLFAQVVLFGGGTGGLRLDPLETVDVALDAQRLGSGSPTSVAMTGTLLTGWLLYGAGAVGLVTTRQGLDRRAAFLLTGIAAGILAALVFVRVGQSQLWFLRSVAELVVLLSAWGLSVLLPQPVAAAQAVRLAGIAAATGVAAYAGSAAVGAHSPGKAATELGLALTALTPLVVVATYLTVRQVSRRRKAGARTPGTVLVVAVLLGLGTGNAVQLGADLLTTEPAPTDQARELFAAGGMEASRYIRDHSATGDVVATNMHCRTPDTRPCDNRHFWVSAYTERRVVIEGWGYSAPTNELAAGGTSARDLPVPYPERLAVNDAAFVQPSADTVGRLVDAYSVDWLLVGRDYEADVAGLRRLHPLVTPVYANDAYVVFEVR